MNFQVTERILGRLNGTSRLTKKAVLWFLSRYSYNLREVSQAILKAGLVVVFLFFINLYNTIFFRILVEFFSMIVSFWIFIVAWNSRRIHENNFLILIGLAYLFVGLVSSIRISVYAGPIFASSGDVNIYQQLRLAGLYLKAGSFFATLFYLGERMVNVRKVFLIYLLIFILIILSIFSWKIFPTAYEVGIGETFFEYVSDFSAAVVLFLATILLFKKRSKMDSLVGCFLMGAIIFQFSSIIIHVPFKNTYSLRNFYSLSFQFMTFYFLYKAVVEIGLVKPYRILFRDLEKQKVDLEKYRDQLEFKVLERTQDLAESNAKLKKEIFHRKTAEKDLLESYKYLGTINRKISFLSELSNHTHKKKKQEILKYILDCAVNLSRAKLGGLYFRPNNAKGGFYLALSEKIDSKYLTRIKFVNGKECPVLNEILKKKMLVRGLARYLDLGKLDLGSGTEYVVILPFMIDGKIKGFMFLGFKGVKSLDGPEVEFLEVFANNAAMVLFSAKILR